MPLYKFDPGDDEPQMQADLLEDDRDQQVFITFSLTQ